MPVVVGRWVGGWVSGMPSEHQNFLKMITNNFCFLNLPRKSLKTALIPSPKLYWWWWWVGVEGKNRDKSQRSMILRKIKDKTVSLELVNISQPT